MNGERNLRSFYSQGHLVTDLGYDLTYKTSLRFTGFGTLEHCGSHVDNLGLGETGPRRNGRMEQNSLVILIFRNIGTSSQGTPKVPKRDSGKCPFHSLFTLNFRSNGKRPRKCEARVATILVTTVGEKSFYRHFAPPHPCAMLTKHFHLTQVCMLPFSNIERGNGGVDTYSVGITIIISCFWHFPTQFVQGCRSQI